MLIYCWEDVCVYAGGGTAKIFVKETVTMTVNEWRISQTYSETREFKADESTYVIGATKKLDDAGVIVYRAEYSFTSANVEG